MRGPQHKNACSTFTSQKCTEIISSSGTSTWVSICECSHVLPSPWHNERQFGHGRKSWRQWTRPSLTEPKTKHLPLRLAAARSEAQIASKSSRNRKMPPIWTRQLMSARDWRRSWATSVPGQQNRRLGLNGWFSKGPVKGGENVFGFFPPPQFLAHRDLSYSWPPSAGCAFNLCLEESKTWVYCVCVIYLYIYIFIIYI